MPSFARYSERPWFFMSLYNYFWQNTFVNAESFKVWTFSINVFWTYTYKSNIWFLAIILELDLSFHTLGLEGKFRVELENFSQDHWSFEKREDSSISSQNADVCVVFQKAQFSGPGLWNTIYSVVLGLQLLERSTLIGIAEDLIRLTVTKVEGRFLFLNKTIF